VRTHLQPLREKSQSEIADVGCELVVLRDGGALGAEIFSTNSLLCAFGTQTTSDSLHGPA